MIYTITVNPAIDYIVDVNKFEIGEINIIQNEKILPGGKGINVSIILNNLGIENIALGFIGGFTGKEIQRKVEELCVKTDFIELKEGLSRINVKIKSEYETAINSNGPKITDEDFEKLFIKIDRLEDEIIEDDYKEKIDNEYLYATAFWCLFDVKAGIGGTGYDQTRPINITICTDDGDDVYTCPRCRGASGRG